MVASLPAPAPGLDIQRLLGAWYVLVTNHGFWRSRPHPRIEHDAIQGAGVGAPEATGAMQMRTSLRFRHTDLLGREQRKAVTGVDTLADDGALTWRGEGLLRLVECRWSVALVDPEHRWLVAWFDRAAVGVGEGLALHCKDPWMPRPQVDEILAQVRAHPFLGARDSAGRLRCDGLLATTQDWLPVL